jgi:hypothetical protein
LPRPHRPLRRPSAIDATGRFAKRGGNVATPITPEGMGKQIEDEIANWRRIVEGNNIKVE